MTTPQVSIDVGFWSGSFTYNPPGPTPTQTISLGTGPDANGIAWIWEKIEGWDSPDVAGAVIQRGGDHGGWPAVQFYAPRTMTVTIRASAPTQYLRDLARALVQQTIPVNDLCLMQYNEPIPKQCWVRRSGRIVETYDNLTEVEFACVLIAPDPRKYGTVLKTFGPGSQAGPIYLSVGTTGTPNTIPWTMPNSPAPALIANSNQGNFETRPVVTITGPIHAPGVLRQSSGQQVSWSQTNLQAGDILVIDFDSRMAWLNPGPVTLDVPFQAANLSGYVAADVWSSWFVLQPGTDSIQLTSAASVITDTGSMMVRARDAWM